MIDNNGISPTREAVWATLDHIHEQLKAATAELEEDHLRAAHEFDAADYGSAEQDRAYQERKAAHHECMGVYRALNVIARAYSFDPAHLVLEARERAAAHHVPIIYDDADDDRQACYRCNDQPATHITIDAELLCGDCRPMTAHNAAAV